MVRDLRDGNDNYIFKVKDGVITDRDGRTTDQLAAAYSATKDELSEKNDVDNVEEIKYDEVGKIGERHKNFILGKINTFLDNAIVSVEYRDKQTNK